MSQHGVHCLILTRLVLLYVYVPIILIYSHLYLWLKTHYLSFVCCTELVLLSQLNSIELYVDPVSWTQLTCNDVFPMLVHVRANLRKVTSGSLSLYGYYAQ